MKNEKTITILTPAYNRASHLVKLYESLLQQTNKDFLWYVVDDGSSDETRQWMEQVIAAQTDDPCICVRYEYKENGGKHTALNQAIRRIDTELTFIVDSDDYLPRDAVDKILMYHEKYVDQKQKHHLCGYSFLRYDSAGNVNTALFPRDEEIASYKQVRIIGNIGGDKAEVYYTDILKQYPFPEIEGEKFLAEDVVWMQMSGPYNMVHINQCIYICDYLEGGLTKSGRRMKQHSPKGMILRSAIYLREKDLPFQVKMKMLLLYMIYSSFAGMTLRDTTRSYRQEVGGGTLGIILLWLPAMVIKKLRF